MTEKQYEHAMKTLHAFADRIERHERLASKLNKLSAQATVMRRALSRVAGLNPDAGEIGEGMLRTIVEEAQQALKETTP